jgi:hypothetical protein
MLDLNNIDPENFESKFGSAFFLIAKCGGKKNLFEFFFKKKCF